MLGYNKKMYILPFDHRSSFVKIFIGRKTGRDLKKEKFLFEYKNIIFKSFLIAIRRINQPDDCLVFLDDEYSKDVIRVARRKRVGFALAVEKSGSKYFDFEHGDSFGEVVQKYNPNFVKALVRFNPDDKKAKENQMARLSLLSKWCRDNKFKFILELLIPPSQKDQSKYKKDRYKYDLSVRPALTLRAISQLRQLGIEPDVWKIEAMETKSDWEPVIEKIRLGPVRAKVAIIMLGRGASFAKVKHWIDNSPKGELNGFAVGRTVWMRPLLDLHQGKISKKQAMNQIADNYLELIRLWEG